MAYEIGWTERSLTSCGNVVAYLRKEWSEKEAESFEMKVLSYLELLAKQPFIGSVANDAKPNIRRTVIVSASFWFTKQHKQKVLLT